MTVSVVASVRARRNLDRRTCDSVRGQRTTPCVPEPDAEQEPAIGGGGVVAVDVGDDLHHQGNWSVVLPVLFIIDNDYNFN